jgi:uncharacterized protein (DUF58 family)
VNRGAGTTVTPVKFGLGLLLVVALATRSGLLLIVFALLAVAGILAHLWGKYALERLEYRRSLERHRCFPGEEMEMRVEMTNRKILPVTYLTVDDTIPLELAVGAKKLSFVVIGKGTLRLLFGLGWYQKVVRHYRLVPQKRGLYKLGPALMHGGDPFGFVQSTREVEVPETLIVYPRIVPLAALGIPSRRPFGDLKSKDRLFEDPMRFAGTRDYQAGDPLSRVHWKASAASGRLQVKQLDPSSNLGLAVFINTWGWDLFWQGADADMLETSCVLAASVVNWATEEGLAVGLYVNAMVGDWGFHLRLPPARGAHVLTQCLEGLARVQAPSRTSLTDLLEAEVPALSYGTSVVIITRQVTEEAAAAIDRVRRTGRPVTLIVAGEDEQELPALPGVRIYRVTGEEALHATVLA